MKLCDRPRCQQPYEIALGIVLAADEWSARLDEIDAIAEDRTSRSPRLSWFVFCRPHAREQYVLLRKAGRTITYREKPS